MKKIYTKPEAEKISFNYRDQVAAASAGQSGSGSFMENAIGIGDPLCGTGGIVDQLFDYAGSSMCA